MVHILYVCLLGELSDADLYQEQVLRGIARHQVRFILRCLVRTQRSPGSIVRSRKDGCPWGRHASSKSAAFFNL